MFAAFVLPLSAFASSKLQVSSKSDFSISDDNFSPGQTVYVKIDASNGGNDKSVLNVRDSSYNILNIYTFSKSGSTFSAGFPAPNSEGYYSLEAQIKSEGSSNVSVKTIKVGNPGSANIKVSVNESIKGTNVSKESQPKADRPLDEEGTTPTQEEVVGNAPTPQRSSNSPVVVTITVMVIIALGVAGFFFVKNNNNQPKTTATTVAQPTSAAISPTIDATDETQIEAIDIGDTDTSDLTSVEKEISSL